MMTKEEIQNTIFQALKDLNNERKLEDQLVVSMDRRLFGFEADLDSLSLVSLIVDVEDAISNQAKIVISLTDDRAMSQTNSPFSDVRALTEYIHYLIWELV